MFVCVLDKVPLFLFLTWGFCGKYPFTESDFKLNSRACVRVSVECFNSATVVCAAVEYVVCGNDFCDLCCWDVFRVYVVIAFSIVLFMRMMLKCYIRCCYLPVTWRIINLAFYYFFLLFTIVF